MDGLSEFYSLENENKPSVPLVEVDKVELDKIVSKYEPRGLLHIRENQISPWYEPGQLSDIPPLILNAGPCSAAYLTNSAGQISIAHFTPDIATDNFFRTIDWGRIKGGHIVIPFPKGGMFIPGQFKDRIKFFKDLNLSIVVPHFMDTKGLPTVANMLIDSAGSQVMYGIQYVDHLKDQVPIYRQLLQG